MGSKTTIEWTHHTFNPWWGCTEVSPGCDNCYARTLAKRFGVKWSSGEARKPASERTWAEPLRWNAKAQKDGVRRRVFCASMADVFDNEGLQAEREWLWELIEETPALDWLLLTKRIGNVMSMVPARWRERFPSHIWIGATIVNQAEADRDIPKLLRIPATVRFLSCEPLLGAIDLTSLRGAPIDYPEAPRRAHWINAFTGAHGAWLAESKVVHSDNLGSLHWVIVGAESGRGARPCDPAWVISLRDQCEFAGVSFFYKQSVKDGIKTSTPELEGRTWVEVPEANVSRSLA